MLRHAWRRVILVLCITMLALPASAQTLLSPSAEPLTLLLTPANPEPGAVVRIRAQSLTLELELARIIWYVDDTLFAEGEALTEIETRVGAGGSATHVSTIVEQEGAIVASSDIYIRPAEVDLLWEADSFVHPFYEGRRLASPGSRVTIEAHARLRDQNGSLLAAQDLIYIWNRNGTLMNGLSGRGKSRASFPAPLLFGSDTISLEVTSRDGRTSAGTSITIPSTDPFVVLYHDHPLFGILYNNALARSALFPDIEAAFVALPYFASSINGPADPKLTYTWKINNIEVIPSQEEPYRLTINAENSDGVARLETEVTHLTNYFLDARGAWDIAFNRIAEGDPFSPFGR